MSADVQKRAENMISNIDHVNEGELSTPTQIARRVAAMLEQRTDAVVGTTLRSCGRPPRGVKIILTEVGVRVEVSDCGLAMQQHGQVIRYLEELGECVGQLPPPTVSERFLIMLQRAARLCILGGFPLAPRKHTLYCLGVAREWVGRKVPNHHQRQQALAVLLSVILDEPSTTVRRLLRQQQFWLEYHYARRLLHLSRGPNSDRVLDMFEWPDRDAYLALAQNTHQARVLVTIHMGDFFGAFKYIAAHAAPDRTVTSLRREEDDGSVQGLLLNNPSGHHIARHGADQPLNIVAALRRGNHTLTALFDLPGSFGETVEVMFFGQPARFVRGPAQLAIMGRAWIVPFVTYEESGRQHIEMASMIRAERRSEESLTSASARVTQQLVTMAERWVRNRPAQWKYLDRMMDYINVATEQSASPARRVEHA